MGLCRNAVAHKLRSGLENGKNLSNRIVEREKMFTLLYGSFLRFMGIFLT